MARRRSSSSVLVLSVIVFGVGLRLLYSYGYQSVRFGAVLGMLLGAYFDYGSSENRIFDNILGSALGLTVGIIADTRLGLTKSASVSLEIGLALAVIGFFVLIINEMATGLPAPKPLMLAVPVIVAVILRYSFTPTTEPIAVPIPDGKQVQVDMVVGDTASGGTLTLITYRQRDSETSSRILLSAPDSVVTVKQIALPLLPKGTEFSSNVSEIELTVNTTLTRNFTAIATVNGSVTFDAYKVLSTVTMGASGSENYIGTITATVTVNGNVYVVSLTVKLSLTAYEIDSLENMHLRLKLVPKSLMSGHPLSPSTVKLTATVTGELNTKYVFIAEIVLVAVPVIGLLVREV